ncbi:MAG: hypothetical protein HC859_11915 [Bacteroidia bacterium]|nr:hypothetical protein [Bacteroidia bacterium]
MSSHHIVKDNQEPALVIEWCPAGYDSPLGELLEWSPLVIVLDKTLPHALSLGFKIDVAVVPYAYAEMYTDMLRHQLPVQLLTYQRDDDPMTTALNYLRAKRTHAVSVLASDPPAWPAVGAFCRNRG